MTRRARALTSFLLAAVLAGLAVPLAFHAGPSIIHALQRPGPEPEPATPPLQQPPQALTLPTVVTGLSADAPAPDPAALQDLIDAELRLSGSGSLSGVVLDGITGESLYMRDAQRGQLPASNVKLFTAAAAMLRMGPDRRMTTSVYRGSEPGSVVLRGGGDVLLGAGPAEPESIDGHAGLATLAEQALEALGPVSGPVSVYVDDSLFTGPSLNPSWLEGDVAAGEIAPVYPLAVGSARLFDGGPRIQDAAASAAEAFRTALADAGQARGIEVTDGVARGTAPAGAAVLATVESATVAQQVAYMLRTSDNYLAEALARLTALAAGESASAAGGTEAIMAALDELGIPTAGMVLGDAAGLSPRTRVTPAQLAALVHTLISTDRPELAKVLNGLPVAGLTGTLAERYRGDGTGAEYAGGAGVVRAKTGTLNAVTALTGYAVSADGRLLVFSFIASGLESNTAMARAAVDGAAAVLAGCGCRGS
jgi:D-alanyl-D-alanine carboxypeptidase/D-alanyl-D-alanine-endopeptidase (penicillin-binding protein 4)